MIWNRDMETANRADLAALQLARLQQTVTHSYQNAPYYRAKMDALGVMPQDIKTFDDIRQLPFTTKQDMRDNYPYGMLATPLQQIVRLHCSSGTTGKPTVVAYTRHDLAIWAEVIARTLTAGGVTDKSVFQVGVNYGLFTGGLGIHYGAETVGASVVPASGGNTARQIMLMQDFGTTAMVVTPSYSLYLAETMRDMGIAPGDTALQALFCGAEAWSDQMHQEVEDAFGVRAFDIYGLSEIIGPGVACECEVHEDLHIQQDHFYCEVIDPLTEEVLPEGDLGELVITTLTKEGMPMIRYRTRDLTRLVPGEESCSCGRTQAKMKRVMGRTDDMLVIRGVNVFPSQVESVLLGLGETAPHYQLIVEREHNLDILTILVEKSEQLAAAAGENVNAVERKIRERMKVATAVTAAVRLVEPKTIERSEGKAKRVIDKRVS
ncbi:MAG: phenylacetate--CoA ligase [Negativicutes bacterium]|nr:phenylacetate--CoA ligase [Negativicutes bacterium]